MENEFVLEPLGYAVRQFRLDHGKVYRLEEVPADDADVFMDGKWFRIVNISG